MNTKIDTAEAAAQWIEKAGYAGDLSAITAGIHDITEGMEKMHKEWIPSLLRLDPSERDESLNFIIDLLLEMEHIQNHAEAACENLIVVRDFLAGDSSAH